MALHVPSSLLRVYLVSEDGDGEDGRGVVDGLLRAEQAPVGDEDPYVGVA